VDPSTDAAISRAIRTEFASATVITIAHRLGTVIDADLVMVMGGGQVLEAGPPHELLSAPVSGAFRSLVEETGPASTAALAAEAAAAYARSAARRAAAAPFFAAAAAAASKQL
jgi:ABC-type transport system involved in cytochrome bd biosynthesis fused ATPase/permease subunit